MSIGILDDKFKIKVIGVGDFGINVIKNFGKMHLSNVECFDMNTDWALKTTNKFIKIGTKTTKGLGAGSLAQIGEKSAEEDKDAIKESIKDCNLLIIVAGLGGGTGSGASIIVAKTAKELNIPSIAFVTTPPKQEAKIRHSNAQYGIDNLKSVVDALFVLSIEKYQELNLKDISNKSYSIMFEKIDKIFQENLLKVIKLFNDKFKTNSVRQILKTIVCDNVPYFYSI